MNPWSKLPARERGAYIRAGVRNGLRSLDAIERAYGEYASGGDLDATSKRRMTDEEYRKKIREIAAANARKWGMSAEDAYRYMTRQREYDYRSYYNDNTKDYSPTADREMPERYKTYWNPTFTRESKYSGVKNGKYNPQGAVGGHWENGKYIPADEYHARLQEELKKREASTNRAYSYGPGGRLSGTALTGNKADEGGTKPMSDIEFSNLMYNLAGINAKYWGVTQEEAYREMLNDPTYDYRGFYEANPNAQNNTETHWPDTYKTYLHPTFSNESIYSGRIVFPYNPTGAVGGRWEGDEYIPNDEYHRRSWEEEKARMNQRAKGGRLTHKFDGTSEPTQRLYQNSQGNTINESQMEELFWKNDPTARDYREIRVPVAQQQPVDNRMFEGNLNEITVRPDTVYNSDLRNIPAIETTEEPISDEIRRRYTNSVGQQRRQAQMTPAEQWADYYNNLANLSYEDRVALENDRKFKRFIGGVAGAVTALPALMPLIGYTGAGIANNMAAFNPATYVDYIASKLGASTAYDAFGATTIPGMMTNAYLGAEMGHEGYKDLRYNKDKKWHDYPMDILGITGGLATGAELGLKSAPKAYNIMKPLMTKARRAYIKTNRQIHAKSIAEKYIDRLNTRMDEIEREQNANKQSIDKARELVVGSAIKMRKELADKITLLMSNPEEVREVKNFRRKRIQDFHSKYPHSNIEEYKANDLDREVQDYADALKRELIRVRDDIDKVRQHYSFDPTKDAQISDITTMGRGTIDIQKASYDDIEAFAKKHNIDISTLFEKGPNGELVLNIIKAQKGKVRTTFNSGEGEIPIFGEVANNLIKSGKYKVELTADADIEGGTVVISPKETPSSLYYRIQNPGGDYTIREHSNVTHGYDDIHKQNIEYIEKKLGAKIFGSSSIEGIPHWKHDYDVIMTDEQAAKVIPGYNNFKLNTRGKTVVDLGELEGKGAGYYTTRTNEGMRNFGEIDVNIIQTGQDGKAEGYIAEEIFRQFFPDEYSKAAVEASLHGGSKYVKTNKTPQELLKAYDADVKTIMDCLEMGAKPSDGQKHALRIFGYINYADPEIVAKSIQKAGEMTDGAYKKAPNFDFTNVEANKKLLNRMKVPYMDIADDPQKMQNMFDYYCLNRTTAYRGIHGDYPDYAELNKTFEVWPNTGGSAMGYGTNNVGGGYSGYGPFTRLRQLPVNYKGVSSPMEALDRVDRATGTNLKLTAKEAQFLNDRVGKYTNIHFREGNTTHDLLWATATREGWEALSRALEELGIYALSGDNYGNGTYMSVINSIPISLPNGELLSVPRYFNKPFEYMNSVEDRVNPVVQSLMTGLHQNGITLAQYSSNNGIKNRVVWNPYYTIPLKEEELPEIPFRTMYEHIRKLPSEYEQDISWLTYNEHLDNWSGHKRGRGWNTSFNRLSKIKKNIDDIKFATKAASVVSGLPGGIFGTIALAESADKKNLMEYVNAAYNEDMKEIDAERNTLFEQYKNGEIDTEEYKNGVEDLEKEREDLNHLIINHPLEYESPMNNKRQQKAWEEYIKDKKSKKNKKNKKSYGGLLEPHNQYGIGGYINY